MADTLTYVVEPMTLDDLDQVMEIEQLAFSSPWSARAYRFEINENAQSTMLVVRPAITGLGPLVRLARRFKLATLPRVLGYGGFWLLVDEAHVCTLAVHPERRGQGLGQLLLLSLLERAARSGAHQATLEVRVSNLAALALYGKFGFRVASRQRRYYVDNQEDAFIMATPSLQTPTYQAALRQHRARLNARLGLWSGPGNGASTDHTAHKRGSR